MREIVLASEIVENITIKLLRKIGTPKLCLVVDVGGKEVWRSKHFLTKHDLRLSEKTLGKVEAELEEEGVPILSFKDKFEEAFLKVIDRIPSKVIVPNLDELGLSFRKLKVEDISAKYLYEPVEIEGQITGMSEFLSIPVLIELVCKRHGERIRKYIDFLNPRNLEMLLFKQRSLIRSVELKANLKGEEENHAFIEDETRRVYIDLKILKLRGLPEAIEKFTETLQFKVVDVYLIGHGVPRSKKVRIRGYVVNRPMGNMNKLVIVAFDIEPLNELAERFMAKVAKEPEILNEIRKILPPYMFDVKARYNELKKIIDNIIAPKIVGREFEKLSSALALASPDKIVFESTGETMYGMLRIMHFGDTKTGKTETNAYIPFALGLGDYVTCETGTRTGILYTIDPELKAIIWGTIPLCDREVAVIDGFNALPKEEMKEFREALEHFRVFVRRFVQGDAWARTRIIAIANPKRHLKKYAYNIEAVKEISSLREEPDYTRFDLFIPWAAEDVEIEEITGSSRGRDVLKEDLFRKLVLISWNTTVIIPRDVEASLNQIVNEAVKKAKGLDVPIVHAGWKKVIAKIAAAFTCLLQKFTIKNGKIIANMDMEALEMTKIFLQEYFDRLDLIDYIAKMKTDIDEEEFSRIKEQLRENDVKILEELYKRGKATRSELASLLNMTAQNLTKNYIPKLRELRLVTSISGKGLVLTDRGREFVAKLLREKTETETEGGIPPSGSGIDFWY